MFSNYSFFISFGVCRVCANESIYSTKLPAFVRVTDGIDIYITYRYRGQDRLN